MTPVIYTALFSNYEELKEPLVVTPGWRYICFTDQPVTSEVWEIIKAPLPADVNPQLLARYYKIMEFVDYPKSIWIDASFIIDHDLNVWWDKYFKGGITTPAHPLRSCVYEECMDCIISGRGDRVQVDAQMNEYRRLGIPSRNGVIQSGLMMRENTPEVIEFCEAWWKELSTHSIRDQIAFAKISYEMRNLDLTHTYIWDYRMSRDFIYKHHFNRR